MPFETLLINGLSLGSVYALIAFGFVAVYKTNRILNFAHAPLGALGALILASLISDGAMGIRLLRGDNPLTAIADHPAGWASCLVLALLMAGGLGALVERFAIRPMRGRPSFTVTIATVGVAIVLQRFADQAPVSRALPMPWGAGRFDLFGTDIGISSLVICLLAPAVLGGLRTFDRTRFGIATRAFAADQEAAAAQGINPNHIAAFSWGLAAALATLAALTFSVPPLGYGTFSTAAMPTLFFRAVPVLALGGWDSYGGVYVAGIAIGMMQVMSGGLLSSYMSVLGSGYSTVLPYVVMLIVLLIRPAGLFGRRSIQRV